ncbi:MAG TPA: radical SAM protein [Dehalococcoidia bacterium]|nr:radical SAM protein [Dehalococcoidia bacterium]
MRIQPPFSTVAQDTTCAHCRRRSRLISRGLGLCLDCIRGDFEAVLPHIEKAHSQARAPFHLPGQPPQDETGAACRLCVNECQMAPGQKSYCGLRTNEGGKLMGASADRGRVSWYYDPLPTNCVADWVCPAGSDAGYPRFSYSSGPEYGYRNLAVFYQACSFDCLFCQNWHFRYDATRAGWVSAASLARAVNQRTACICYFGGDPSPQMPHALRASRLALEHNQGRILRICWETNGSMHPSLLRQAVELSLKSGGCIKFDLKAWNPRLHRALCGMGNERTLENFRLAAQYLSQRPDPPLVVASTLLVPGYVDEEEVAGIAAFIAQIDPDIPYALLAFHPHFYMADLPPTSRRHAVEAQKAALAQGLRRVRIGNLHLLGDAY